MDQLVGLVAGLNLFAALLVVAGGALIGASR